MKYDLSEIEIRVAELKRKFKISITVTVLLFFASAVLAAIYYGKDDRIVFFSGLAAFFCLFYLVKALKTYSPQILFSPEIRGVNILEEEFVLNQRRGMALGSKYAMYRPKPYGTAQRRYNIAANVYIRDNDGEVHIIKGLTQAHTDLYVEGDVLFKPAGVKYPIIASRDVDKQPCPCCGYINGEDSDECKRCGLGIFKS